MKAKLAAAWMVVALVAVAGIPVARAQTRPKTVRIGVVIDGPWQRNAPMTALFQQEIRDLVKGEFAIEFPPDKQLEGDWTAASVAKHVDALLADPKVDIVLTMGVIASHDVAVRAKLPKPVIAPFIIDRRIQGLPFDKGTSGRKNLSYLVWPWSMGRDLQAFREVADHESVVFVANKYFIEVVPDISTRVKETAKAVGVRMSVVAAGMSADEVLAALPADAGAVYMAPLIHMPPAEYRKLLDGLIARKLPTFSAMGRFAVDQGVLVGLRPADDFTRIARRVAVNVQRILLGDDPASFGVTLRLGEELAINMATARAIGLSPSWIVLTEAVLVSARRTDAARSISLRGAMKAAVDGNVDLAAAREVVVGGRADVRGARANLLPSVEASTTVRTIDQDRASALTGNPQHLWTGDLSVTQVVYSDRAWAGYSIQKHAQRSREHELETTRLDVVLAVGVAYLNVLRAVTFERIQRQNLRRTRQNVDLARTRVEVGSGNPAEVYRWESQIANDRKAVIEASAQRNLAEIELNRILHRPLEEPFSLDEESLTATTPLSDESQLSSYVGDPWTFKVFRRFMIEQAVAHAPELAQLDDAIAAQKRAATAAKRTLWAPTVAVSGGLTQRFGRAGEGADDPAMPIPGFEAADGTSWFVALNLSLPLYDGGARYADIDKTQAELSRLRLQREAARERIAQRIDSALHLMGASYAGIRLSREAATAAAKNLALVTDAYAKGAVTLIELIDAQNAALSSELLAANAVYDFLIDWMNVQRATGKFTVELSDAQLAEFFSTADAFIARARADENR